MPKRKPDITKENTMTTKELCKLVSERTGYSENSIYTVIQEFHKTITDCLASGYKKISLRPYYKIEVNLRKGYMPHTCEWIINPDKIKMRDDNYYPSMKPLGQFLMATGWDCKLTRNYYNLQEKKLKEKVAKDKEGGQ